MKNDELKATARGDARPTRQGRHVARHRCGVRASQHARVACPYHFEDEDEDDLPSPRLWQGKGGFKPVK